MQESIDDGILRQIDPGQDYLWKWIPSRGRSGGILSGVNLQYFDVGSFMEGKYFLQLNLWDKDKKMKWNFINVYGAAQEENKIEFLTELADTIHKIKEPVLLGGDFNIIRHSKEKNKGGIHKHTGLFNSIINTYELIDIHMSGGRYTLSNNQINPTLERLDRYLVSKDWESTFPLALVHKLPREISGHNPIILSTCSKPPLKKLNFRFELTWLKHPDFMPKVQELWDHSYSDRTAFDRIQLKLKKKSNSTLKVGVLIFKGLGRSYVPS
jgi:hypothetical protein